MARFWDVQDGEVLLGGQNVKEYSFDALMRNFSFVFQSVYLFETRSPITSASESPTPRWSA